MTLELTPVGRGRWAKSVLTLPKRRADEVLPDLPMFIIPGLTRLVISGRVFRITRVLA